MRHGLLRSVSHAISNLPLSRHARLGIPSTPNSTLFFRREGRVHLIEEIHFLAPRIARRPVLVLPRARSRQAILASPPQVTSITRFVPIQCMRRSFNMLFRECSPGILPGVPPWLSLPPPLEALPWDIPKRFFWHSDLEELLKEEACCKRSRGQSCVEVSWDSARRRAAPLRSPGII